MPKPDPAEALAATLKHDIDRLLYRFAGLKPSPAVGKRIELAIRNEMKRNPIFAPIADFDPLVIFDPNSSRPTVMFVPPPPKPANSNARAA